MNRTFVIKKSIGVSGIFCLAALMVLPNLSRGATPQDLPLYRMVLITAGDIHLLGNPKKVDVWWEEVVKEKSTKEKAYSMTFTPEKRLLSADYGANGTWQYQYEGANLVEIVIKNTGSNKDENYATIVASHKNNLGEPDIFVSKSYANRGAWSSTSVNGMVTVKRKNAMVTYGEYMLLDDKPVLGGRVVAYYQPDKLLKKLSIYYAVPVSNEMKEKYAQTYEIVNSVVTRMDTVGDAAGVPALQLTFDHFEFDACKNWIKRMAHQADVKRDKVTDVWETREISYHAPCE